MCTECTGLGCHTGEQRIPFGSVRIERFPDLAGDGVHHDLICRRISGRIRGEQHITDIRQFFLIKSFHDNGAVEALVHQCTLVDGGFDPPAVVCGWCRCFRQGCVIRFPYQVFVFGGTVLPEQIGLLIPFKHALFAAVGFPFVHKDHTVGSKPVYSAVQRFSNHT